MEIFSRLLPASDLLSLETPIECLDLNNIDLKCLPRRKSGEKGFYTLGALPPLPVKALKKANDIGQLTNVNFYDFKSKQLQNLPIISIGDSQVAALQVNNEDTFHGLLNQYKIQSGSEKIYLLNLLPSQPLD